MKLNKIILISISIIIILFGIRYFITWDIWDAVRKNRVCFVISYLNHGGNANFARNNQWMDGPNEQNFTLLMEAARRGKPDIVKVLLLNSADPNVTTSIGRTALLFAAENGNLKSTELLIKNGADINYSYSSGSVIDIFIGKSDILGQAIFYGHVEVVNFLINQGIDIKKGHLDLAKEMLEHEKKHKPIIIFLKHLVSNYEKNLESIIYLLQKHLSSNVAYSV